MAFNKMKYRRSSRKMPAKARKDRIIEHNPVFVIGLGLSPIVMAGYSLNNALIIGLAVAMLLTPTRFISSMVGRLLPYRLRGAVYAVVAGGLYIGVYYILNRLFGASLMLVGIYLPLLVMDPLLISRFENPFKERPLRAIQKGLAITAGFEVALFLTSAVREILAAGTLFGRKVLSGAPAPMAGLMCGGLIAVALLSALWRNMLTRREKKRERGAKAW